jgi:vacuole morphology and inheritance protein 14
MHLPDIRETSKAVNYNLMRLITNLSEKSAEKDGQLLINVEDGDTKTKTEASIIDLPSVIDVLTRHLQNTAVPTKVAVLRWIYHLYLKMPRQMFVHVDETFPILLKTLSDPSDEVVLLSLEVLAEVVSFSSKNING